jgi:hypothetical protein
MDAEGWERPRCSTVAQLKHNLFGVVMTGKGAVGGGFWLRTQPVSGTSNLPTCEMECTSVCITVCFGGLRIAETTLLTVVGDD